MISTCVIDDKWTMQLTMAILANQNDAKAEATERHQNLVLCNKRH